MNWGPQSTDITIIDNNWANMKRKKGMNLSLTRETNNFRIRKPSEGYFIEKFADSATLKLKKASSGKRVYIFYINYVLLHSNI